MSTEMFYQLSWWVIPEKAAISAGSSVLQINQQQPKTQNLTAAEKGNLALFSNLSLIKSFWWFYD